jgi:hypothetical protein
MSNLADFRSRVLITLGDSSGARFTASVIDLVLARALDQYSRAYPQIKTGLLTVTETGRDQPLVGLSDLQAVISICFPYHPEDVDNESFIEAYRFNWIDGVPALHFDGASIPRVGDLIKVTYASPQTIEDLEGASASTIRPDHEHIIVVGAAAHAADMRAAELLEMYGSRASDKNQLTQAAANHFAFFYDALETLRLSNPPLPPTGLQRQGWRLDSWDLLL